MNDDPDELLTTTQAAQLVGHSRQHIADLCDTGQLPHTRAGTHRRIRRGDLQALLNPSATPDAERDLWLHHAIAGKLVANPDRVLAAARRNLKATSLPPVWAIRWQWLIDSGPDAVLTAILGTGPSADQLRVTSPLRTLLSAAEQDRIITAWAGHRHATPAVPAARTPGDGSPSYADLRPYTVADNLDDLTGPTSGTITLPRHIDWSGSPTRNLDEAGMLPAVYQTVLNEASRVEDLNTFLNRDALIRLWPDLHLSPKVRRLWQDRFPQLTQHPTPEGH